MGLCPISDDSRPIGTPDRDAAQLLDGSLGDVLEEAQDHAARDAPRPAARAGRARLEDGRAVRIELQDGRERPRMRHGVTITAAG